MQIVLTGAGGQLAADLAQVFESRGHRIATFSREDLDIADEGAVRSTLDAVGPDLVLNPAAYNRVDAAEREIARAFSVNAYAPRLLARYCDERGITLVHYSTDYVVDGLKRTPYTEDDVACPISAYATSKLAGEHFVRAVSRRHYVVRVCGLFGPAGRRTRHGNFVETMLRAAGRGQPLHVVCDQVVAPTSTVDVAAATLALIDSGAPYGLYHCTASGETSWHDFARAIFELAGVAADLRPVTAVDLGAAARRPAYSILANSRLEALGIPRPCYWRDALAAYLVARRETEQGAAARPGGV